MPKFVRAGDHGERRDGDSLTRRRREEDRRIKYIGARSFMF